MKASHIVLSGMMLALAGCGGIQLQKAEGLDPSGTEFSKGLYGGYLDLARLEYSEADFRDSDVFARRAKLAAVGSLVEPEAVDARRLPADRVGVLSGSRERLMAALAQGAAEKLPADTARAQVAFDCWMQEQEENIQPDDIAACQADFTTAIAAVEDGLAPPPPAPVAKVEPAPAPDPRSFVLMYDLDDSNVMDADKAKLDEALAFAASLGSDAKVTVSGYADRAGADEYNVTLAKLRAQLIADSFNKAGVRRGSIDISSFGEDRPAVQTNDGIAEPLNRRVSVVVSQ
ncbi:MAG: OmpA family protein [Alphaproteobacteria bacterium]